MNKVYQKKPFNCQCFFVFKDVLLAPASIKHIFTTKCNVSELVVYQTKDKQVDKTTDYLIIKDYLSYEKKPPLTEQQLCHNHI